MDEQAQRFVYEFGEFQLDPRRAVLRSRRPDWQPIDLTPKALGVLVQLVEHAGETVSKAALIATVWPGVIVEEGNLSQTIHVLRKVLGEHPDEHRFIVTVPGRGYRFVADVVVREDVPTRSPVAPAPATTVTAQPARSLQRLGWKHLLIAIATLALPAAGYFALRQQGAPPSAPATDRDHSIAVLPFADLSPERDHAWFASGLAEEVLILLATSPDLRVIARTSSFSPGIRDLDVAAIAERLDVGHVLEGSVRRMGNEIRITAQLIDTADSSQVWSATYDRNLADVFAVQSEISAAVVNALRLEIQGLAPNGGARPPGSGPAWEHFLRGRFYYNRRAPGDLDLALAAYGQALAIDKRFARAWAGVAAVYAVATAEGTIPRDIGLPRLLEAAQNATRFDPQLTEGHVRLSRYYSLTGERDKAREHFLKAAAMDPRDMLVISVEAGRAATEGRYLHAVARQREVVSLDPLSATAIGNLGAYLVAAGQLEEAKMASLRALELGGDERSVADIGRILALQGKYSEALALVEHTAAGAGRDLVLALACFSLGRRTEADAALARLAAAAESKDPFPVAEVYAWRGELDQAFHWLTRATTPGVNGSLPAARLPWEMKASPLLAPLHGDARWAAWVAATPKQ